MPSRFCRASLALACAGALFSTAARAADPAPDPGAPAATAVSAPAVATSGAPAAPLPPYSLPWQLRGVSPTNVVRSDNSFAFYKNAAGVSGNAQVTMLLASYKLTPNLAPLVRLGVVKNDVPGTTADGSTFINPVAGLTYGRRAGSVRWSGFGGVTIPIGMGAGDGADSGERTANATGIAARAGMDNAMFAVNYLTAILGGDVAYVDHKLTVQGEVTLFQLFRVHGSDTGAQSSDATRTNSTYGLHVGYFVIPQLSLGGELRYQRWLSTVTSVNATTGAKTDIPDYAKDTLSFAVGPRGNFAVGKGMFLRPGISYARGLDRPLKDSSYNVVQVDVPLVF